MKQGSTYSPMSSDNASRISDSSFRDFQPCIRVVGVGGAGGNAVSDLARHLSDDVETICMNSDAKALRNCKAKIRLQLGGELTRGRGTGGNAELGNIIANNSREEIRLLVTGADVVFIVAGLGGGFGSGAISEIAELAREEGALAICFVTMPFDFEGRPRQVLAQYALRALLESADTVIVIPNERLFLELPEDTRFVDAFRRADKVLSDSVHAVSSLVASEGMVNVDFADLQTVMCNKGIAMVGAGEATGKDRALVAAVEAISSTLLDPRVLAGASKILLNFAAGEDITLREINEAAEYIRSNAHEDAQIIWGIVLDPSLALRLRVTIMATGMADFEWGISSMESPALLTAEGLESPEEDTVREDQVVRPRPKLQSVG